MSSRLYWVDLLKFIGIYLVILGHHPSLDEESKRFIYSFHMPLFYMISGYLTFYKEQKFYDVFKKHICRLMIPYSFFRILGYIWWICFSYMKHEELFPRDQVTIFKPLVAIFLGLGYNTDFAYTVCTPVWFLFSLFWLKIVSIYILPSFRKSIFAMLFSIIIVMILKYLDFHAYFSLENALLAFPFYIIGYYLRHYSLLDYIKGDILFIICILTLFLSFIQLRLDRIDMCTVNYGSSLILFYIFPTLFVICLMKLFENYFNCDNKFVDKISSGTIIILGIHQYFLFILNKIFPTGSLVGCVLISFCVLLLCFPFISLFNKYIPVLVGSKPKHI